MISKFCTVSVLLLILANSYCHEIQAQSNLRCKWLTTESDHLFLDTLLIAPETIEIKSVNLNYEFDFGTRELRFEGSEIPDSVFVCYRTYPEYLTQTSRLRSYDEYDSLAPFQPKGIHNNRLRQKEELFHSEDIYKSGSLTRGISFGNSQSLGVTSSLNFQMEGKLTDDLNIRANITDQNIPFQPEGNTQQLREFDNVSIEVFNDKLSLTAGDIVLKSRNDYFLKYYKNVQGGQFNINHTFGEKGTGTSSVTISSAKGQFADVTIDVQEGVQGPYKLRGPNGERFIIVLANSENIYLDGIRLERGFNQDYVIDYNLGEITFNPTVLITRFSRVRATYEYSDRNYSRSILNTYHEFEFGKTKLNFNFYRERDSKNSPLSFELSDDDKLSMSLAGEDNIPIQIAGETLTQFNENTIQYIRKDTTNVDGLIQGIFQFSTDSTENLFRVTFSELGAGRGDYVLLSNTANGRIFEWVSPIAGEPQGSYSPVQFVPAPNQRQMTTFGVSHQVSNYLEVYSEFAVSNHDLNLFSGLDADDDTDMAMKTGLILKDRPVGLFDGYKLSSTIDFEYDGEHFNPIDRFRYIEFDRDWSFDPTLEEETSSDNIFNFTSLLEKDINNKISYRFSSRKRGSSINGSQQQLVLDQSLGGFQLSTGGYLMQNTRRLDESDWIKAHGELKFNNFRIVPGYRFELDQNVLKLQESDSVLSTAMNYTSHKFFLSSNDSLKTRFKVEHTFRTDRQPVNGTIDDFTSTNTTRLGLDSNIGKTNNVNVSFTYRTLEFLKFFSENENEETILGKLNWSGAFMDNHIRSDLSYATSSSREIRREFIFVPVVTGEGTHTWRDLNEDGLQDIMEFFESINFDERNYIKIFVPTDDFISAFNNLLNWNLNFFMPRGWKGSHGIKDFLGRFTNNTNVNINKKNTDTSFGNRFNPFQLDIEDQNLIFVRSAIRSTLFFNRSNPGFGFDLAYFASSAKQLISNGIDSRSQHDWVINIRKRLTSELSLAWRNMRGNKNNQSDFLEDRNFKIQTVSTAPQLIWQPTPKFRISSEFDYQQKQNVLSESEDESSRISSLNTSLRWNKALKNSMDASFKFTNIEFSGDENSPAGYELLEALGPGRNYIWNFSYRQKLANGLQVVMSYNGRKSSGQRVVHLGRMQVSTFF